MTDPADQGKPAGRRPPRIQFLGHATVLIDIDGTTLVTDPLLRGRISALMRRSSLPREASTGSVDFPEMAALGPIDVALLPVAGWGPVLGPGHLDPFRAARALRLIRPKIAIPIHLGTFAPVGLHLRPWPYLVSPPLDFVDHARDLAPDVEVRVLGPGEFVDLGMPSRRAPSGGPSIAGGARSAAATGRTGTA